MHLLFPKQAIPSHSCSAFDWTLGSWLRKSILRWCDVIWCKRMRKGSAVEGKVTQRVCHSCYLHTHTVQILPIRAVARCFLMALPWSWVSVETLLCSTPLSAFPHLHCLSVTVGLKSMCVCAESFCKPFILQRPVWRDCPTVMKQYLWVVLEIHKHTHTRTMFLSLDLCRIETIINSAH